MDLDQPIAALDGAASGRTGLGSRLLLVLLGGLWALPGYLGLAAGRTGAHHVWVWLGVVLALAVLGAVWLVSRRVRRHDTLFTVGLLTAAGLNLVLGGIYVAMTGADQSWSTTLSRSLFLLVAPLASMVAVAISTLTGGRR